MPILQVNFKLNVSPGEYASSCEEVAQAIAGVPGLYWKVWILNEAEKEAGGLYYFETDEALNDYLSGPIVAQLKRHPGLRDVSAKRFDVMETVTRATRGPIARIAAAGH